MSVETPGQAPAANRPPAAAAPPAAAPPPVLTVAAGRVAAVGGSALEPGRSGQTPDAGQRLRALQLRAFVLTWVSYASYYFARKNLAVSKTRLQDSLGLSTTALGSIDTVYLLAYAIGQFANGALGDRIGPRRLIAMGMLASAGMALCFGLSFSFWPMFLAWGINGLFQASGWPGNVKAMQPFFPSGTRGRVMGLWTTNYQAGGLVATALATFLLVRLGWRAAFILPALWVALVGAAVLLLLVEKPEDRGLPPVEPAAQPAEGAPGRADAHEHGPTLGRLLKLPVLWTLGAAYFGIKLIRYSLLFWLPFYLTKHLHYTEGAAGYLSLPFEIGGIVGSIAVGWFSDRYFRTRRLWVATPVLFFLALALLFYQRLGGTSVIVNAGILAAVGFLLFGPDSLLSGTTAQDLGGTHATGRVAGIINGMGSVGAVFSPALLPRITQRFGWDSLFIGFCGLTLVSALLLGVSALLLPRARRALSTR